MSKKFLTFIIICLSLNSYADDLFPKKYHGKFLPSHGAQIDLSIPFFSRDVVYGSNDYNSYKIEVLENIVKTPGLGSIEGCRLVIIETYKPTVKDSLYERASFDVVNENNCSGFTELDIWYQKQVNNGKKYLTFISDHLYVQFQNSTGNKVLFNIYKKFN